MEKTTILLCIAALAFVLTIDAKSVQKPPKESPAKHVAHDIGTLFKGKTEESSPLFRHLERVLQKRLQANPTALKQALLNADRGLKKAAHAAKLAKPVHQLHKEVPHPHPAQTSQKIGYQILDRVYWKDSVATLYGRIFKYAHLNKGTGGSAAHSGALQKGYLEKKVKDDLKYFQKLLKKLTDKQLKELFWKVQAAIKRGDVTPDGKVIIDGKKYDLKELASYCCPFG